MTNVQSTDANVSKPVPRNKGKIIGAKPPLRPKHVWSIRTKLQVEGRIRDLALFNVAIDSKLRGCDVVALKVDDVAPAFASASARKSACFWLSPWRVTRSPGSMIASSSAVARPGETSFPLLALSARPRARREARFALSPDVSDMMGPLLLVDELDARRPGLVNASMTSSITARACCDCRE
jgi:hypothetical protein